MTREELRDEVAHTLIECRGDGCGSFEMADAVIRLVVEACAAEVELFLRTDKYAWPPNIPNLLRRTFLPPKDPSNG
mgnify:CR=1 FL=1